MYVPGTDGHKMSKSRGNLVLVSRLREDGVDPMVIRLVLLAQHYRTDWDYTPELLAAAQTRFERWREALSVNTAPSGDETVAEIRAALSDDLDAPRAVAAMDTWSEATLTTGGDEASAPGVLGRALDALLGVRF